MQLNCICSIVKIHICKLIINTYSCRVLCIANFICLKQFISCKHIGFFLSNHRFIIIIYTIITYISNCCYTICACSNFAFDICNCIYISICCLCCCTSISGCCIRSLCIPSSLTSIMCLTWLGISCNCIIICILCSVNSYFFSSGICNLICSQKSSNFIFRGTNCVIFSSNTNCISFFKCIHYKSSCSITIICKLTF